MAGREGKGIMGSMGKGRALLFKTVLGMAAMGACFADQAVAGPAGPAVASAQSAALPRLSERVIFHHRRRSKELYCVDGNYWWYYRPYQTGGEDYPRCMPYFHYREQAGGGYPAEEYPVK